MGRLYIAESELNSVHYDHETKTLEVEYLQKGSYQYSNVSFHIYQGLMVAENKQHYLECYVMKKYAFIRVYY